MSRLAAELCILGAGAVTAIGHNLPMTAAAARARIPRLRETEWLDRGGQPMVAARVPLTDESLQGPQRLLQMGLPALRETLQSLGGLDWHRLRLRWYLGLSPERPGFPAGFAEWVAKGLAHETGLELREGQYTPIPRGHASVFLGLEYAIHALRSRQAELCLVGGVDSSWHPDTMDWLDNGGRLGSEENPDGFIPGEGAGFLLVSTTAWAHQQKLQPLAGLLALATAEEPHPVTSSDICIGSGLTLAVRQVLAGLGPEQKADWVICDLNGESYRATEWVYAYLRTGKRHRDPLALWHPSDCYGDVGAASGAIQIGIALSAFRRRYARGPHPLVWASSDDGLRGAALLSAPPAAQISTR